MTSEVFRQEHDIALKEFKLTKEKTSQNTYAENLPSPNKMALTGVLVLFSALMFVPSVRETLATPLVADQYGLSDSAVVFITSLTVCATNLLAAGILFWTAKLTTRMEDRQALLFCALLPLLASIALHYPIGDTPIVIANCTSTEVPLQKYDINQHVMEPDTTTRYHRLAEILSRNFWKPTLKTLALGSENEDGDCYGCPFEEQPWCLTTPQITPVQLILAYTFTRTSSTTAITFTQVSGSLKVCDSGG